MPHSESSYTTHDGKKLFTQQWQPEEAPKAAVFLIHGLAEHSGRYAHLAAKLNRAGYAVYAFDGRGHGRSAQPRPDAYYARIDDYLRDIDGLFLQMKAEIRDLPCFIFGHSMGGGLAVHYALQYRPEVDGILLSGAALAPGEDVSPFLVRIASILSALAPRFKALDLESKALTHDLEIVAEYDRDPLVYSEKIPARTGAEMLRMIRYIEPRMEQFDYPVLIMHGTADRLSNPAGSEMLYEKARSDDKTLKLYEGLFHELVNELEREKVMEDMIAWMNERLP